MKRLALAWLLAVVVTVSGCETMNKEQTGGLVGAVAGGILGSTIGDGRGQVIATFAGAVLGALVGSSVGRDLDRYDELQAQHVLEHNRSGEKTLWVNPDAGHEVSVMPTRTFQAESGEYCREYQTTATVGGKTEQAYGTACRQPDGSWKVVN